MLIEQFKSDVCVDTVLQVYTAASSALDILPILEHQYGLLTKSSWMKIRDHQESCAFGDGLNKREHQDQGMVTLSPPTSAFQLQKKDD